MYKSVTRNIQVTVEPYYIAEESDPDDKHFFWAYSVEIVNLGEETVQLRRRYWKITDANGQVNEVSGAGVVGEQPIIRPGERYEYTSGCPLTTASGIMSGSYQMQSDSGEFFNVTVPAFSLDKPDARRVIN
ncbi:Co2+/Mg2+ efflux protein ApaG [Rhizobiales bacterium]|uniref:Co2+/Mg2+ efflux protein ApaG n=1 Tax=Hongsoonwoonella zoysiae TaxID=2821844 RepID=UPI00155F6940|nr:Co2+/Mg2+ efflux protein ApaG [Hongsoonwoonella zoysiae]NRG19641.1 Co2+/Mg2+ efflux protein ApaG [Hongsoonwoonella zoysiae]